MTDDILQRQRHFTALVDYLDEYTDRQRIQIAAAYGAPSPDSATIARTWCADPEGFLATVDRRLGGSPAWQLLEEMAFEHDLPVDVEWLDKRSRTRLTALGLLHATRGPDDVLEGRLPAAVGALMAPRLRGNRPSLPVLLGRMDADALQRLADLYGVIVPGSRIDLVLALAERFEQPDMIDEILERLPEAEWISAAMMVLELGGMCYWQEIFGYDMDTGGGGEDNVIPLMRMSERAEERELAETLVDLGVLYRLEDELSPYPMVAVPEELWMGLWMLGRRWLMEWTATAYSDLVNHGVRRVGAPALDDVQAALKWIVLESERSELFVHDEGLPDAATASALLARGGHEPVFWDAAFNIGLDMRILEEDVDGRITAGIEDRTLLDMPRLAFARQVLLDWCTGFAGSMADEPLTLAVGLDDSWRERVLDMLDERGEFVPLWMHWPGVPSNTTGAGVLRNIDDSTDEMLLNEMALLNGFVWSIKLLWLDLLSMLESERWYSVDQLTELFQLTACLAMFSQLVHLLEQPHFTFYLPVQRASFFTDAVHTEYFRDWVHAIITYLLVPLGAARLSDDAQGVWLDARYLRIESPPGWVDDSRVELLREVLGDRELEFRVPGRAGLHALTLDPAGTDDHTISLATPIAELRKSLAGKTITRFDGRHLFVQ